MKRYGFLVLGLICLVGCATTSGGGKPPREPQAAVPASAPAFFPADAAVDKWERAEPVHYFNSSTLYLALGEAARGYQDYNVRDLVQTRYRIGLEGKERLAVSVCRADDDLNAFGLYSVTHLTEAEPVQLGLAGVANDLAVDFVKGQYFVRIKLDQSVANSKESLLAFARHMADALPGSTELPGFFADFPQDNRVANSERYIARNFMGLSYLNGAYEVGYNIKGQAGRMWLIQTPNPHEALTDLTGIRMRLDASGMVSVELPGVWQVGFWGTDKKLGVLFVFQSGRFIGGTSGVLDRDVARQMAVELAGRLPQ